MIEKTKENFLNAISSKYLFADEIVLDGERIRINQVDNFQYSDQDAINICFTTTQGLHMDMWMAKENGMSFDDFDEQKVVLISDEAHHLNVDTKKKMSADEESSYDIREINKEQKIAISLLVEIQHQSCHNQRLAAACCHVEKNLGRLWAIAALKMRNEVFKCLLLIRTQFKSWIQVLRNIRRENSTAAVFTQGIYFFV